MLKRIWVWLLTEKTRKMNKDNLFKDFVGYHVKAPYRDGEQFKVARGKLEEANGDFVKIVGGVGTIIINIKNIEKMSKI